MDIRPEEYDWALAEIGQYFVNEPDPGTPEADRFDVLSTLPQTLCATAVISTPNARITASVVFNVGFPLSLNER